MPAAIMLSVQGTLPTAKAALYTSPAAPALGTYIKYFHVFVAAGAATQTVELWIKRASGTSHELVNVPLDAKESGDIVSEGESLLLGPGDAIEGQATTVSTVKFTIQALEES